MLIALGIPACQSPTKSIEGKISQFEKQYPHNSKILEIKGRHIHFVWSGNPLKRPLLFVHGSPGSWQGWAEFLLDPKLQENFHILAVDRPGFGGSDLGQVEISMQKQAELISEVLKENHSGLKAILVGHSLGGAVVARIAMDRPEQIDGLVFVASSVSPAFEEFKWFQYPATWSLFRWMIPTELLVCNDEIMPFKNELEKMEPLWNRVQAKALIIQGLKDDLVPPGNVDFLMQKLEPNLVIRKIMVPELNHFIPWKRPDLISDGIFELNKAL